jgi:ribosomal protein L37AE/L43A
LKLAVKDAQRIQKTRLQKDGPLKKPKKMKLGSPHASNEAEKARSKTDERGKMFCPRCGSTDVFWASGLPQIWSVWDCRHCGYRGAFIVKDSKLADKLREEYAKKVSEG